ncbi:MAG TPA: hypothetical protein VHL78_01260, partial [Actinomycetota bacterium]|nr:hypothetical protein [Actinomycetota bacterium]
IWRAFMARVPGSGAFQDPDAAPSVTTGPPAPSSGPAPSDRPPEAPPEAPPEEPPPEEPPPEEDDDGGIIPDLPFPG